MSNYPQMPPLTNEEIAAFLKQPLVAKLCSHNADGTIHIAPLWFDYVDGDLLFGTQDITHKVRNIKQNSDVTVLVDDPNPPLKGYIAYGKATLDYENVYEKRVALFSKYMPLENAHGFAQGIANKWEMVIIRVKPEHVITFDYGKGSLI
jgi:nitroimidazol reductase NimA-like FMN-containing flavoprotein (pyridoxamine 5'-phosphate oxidase superfamily)